MQKPFTFKAYDFTLTAGGSQAILAGGEYFRILSSTGALDVTVEGKGTMPDLLAGQAIKGLPFQRLVLRDKSGAPNTGFILVASSEFVDNRMFGTFDLSATTLAALKTVIVSQLLDIAPRGYGASFSSVDNFAVNTPVQIFAPASNLNGARVHWATVAAGSNTAIVCALLAKSSAPTGVNDGDVVAKGAGFYTAGSNPTSYMETMENVLIPAGKGLYAISTAISAVAKVSANYTLL